jgi:hypothetical protein
MGGFVSHLKEVDYVAQTWTVLYRRGDGFDDVRRGG